MNITTRDQAMAPWNREEEEDRMNETSEGRMGINAERDEKKGVREKGNWGSRNGWTRKTSRRRRTQGSYP